MNDLEDMAMLTVINPIPVSGRIYFRPTPPMTHEQQAQALIGKWVQLNTLGCSVGLVRYILDDTVVGDWHDKQSGTLIVGEARLAKTADIHHFTEVPAPSWAAPPIPEPIQLKRGFWRQRDGGVAKVSSHMSNAIHWPWIGRTARGRAASWSNRGRTANLEHELPADLVEYLGPLPEEELDESDEPRDSFMDDINYVRAQAHVHAGQSVGGETGAPDHPHIETREEWERRQQEKLQRVAEERERKKERTREADRPGLMWGQPVAVPMIMLPGMGR